MTESSVRTRDWRFHVLAFAVCLSSLVFRLQLDGVTVSPDGELYIRLAENLARHGCLSESDPIAAQCVPSWGGQPPGYPLFIATVATLLGPAPIHIVVGQSLAFALALYYLLISAARLNLNRVLLTVSGLVVALSPAVAGVSRWILTETLGAAAALWVLGECCKAIADRKVSVLRISIAVVATALTRWDMIWIVVLPLVIVWSLYAPREALSKSARVLCLAVTPYAFLVLRAGLVGLPLMPVSVRATPDEVPPGFLHFWQRAAISEGATQTFLWGVWGKDYGEIRQRRDWNSFLPLEKPTEFDGLFESLAAQSDGQGVSTAIDLRFEAEARRLARYGGLQYWTKVVFTRGYRMWTSPESIFGWFHAGTTRPDQLLRWVADTERLLFLILLLVSLALARNAPVRSLLAGILAVVCLRTVFLASVAALEIRYLIPTLPLMHFGAVALWAGRRPEGKSGLEKGSPLARTTRSVESTSFPDRAHGSVGDTAI
jgi:hypothetical protein